MFIPDVQISLDKLSEFSKDSVKGYASMCDQILANLHIFENDFKIENESDYEIAYIIKGYLCTASCYTFNNNHSENDRVWELENVYGKAMAKYNKRFLFKNPEAILIANYLLSSKYYVNIDNFEVISIAKKLNILRKSNGYLYVVGLSKKVGDNVFTVDCKGRGHRQYQNTIGRQAFPFSNQRYEEFINNSFLNGIEELSKFCNKTDIGDYKNCCKTPPLCHFIELQSVIYSNKVC